MSDLRILGSAVWRELYSRRKAYLVSTGLLLALIVGGMLAVATTIDGDATPTVAVGVLDGPVDRLEAEIVRRVEPEAVADVRSADDRGAAEDALRSGELSALIVSLHEVVWSPSTSSWAADMIASAMRAVSVESVAAELGISDSDIIRLIAPIEGRTIDFEERDESVAVVASISVILMFLAIIAYGQWIAYGVVEEKANRVAELVLGAISPTQLLVVKLATLGGLGLLQLLVVGSAAVISGSALVDIPMPPVAASTLIWLVGWFLLGFAFYGTLYAAAGSLAATTQDAGSAIGPLNILPGIGYMVGLIAVPAGNDTLPRILSMIPLWTPLLMPARIAQGTAAGWEVAVAVAIMLASIFVMIRVAARVYLGGITQATRSVGWRQAFRSGVDHAG
jgi:ABC-2 type transport system permease protein